MNTFELLIYAVAGLALLLVFFQFINPYFQETNHLKEIQNGIENAKLSNNLGKTMNLGTFTYPKDATILTTSFDKAVTLVAIECNSPQNCCQMKSAQNEKCTKAISWDSTFFTANFAKSIPTYTRCIMNTGLYICKIYVGATPAQAVIEKAELNSTGGETGTGVKLTLKNSGSVPITNATVSFELQKKGPSGWEATDYAAETKTIEMLNSGDRNTLYFTINPSNTGEYRAEFTFEAQNGGFDKKDFDFNKTTNTSCTATTIGETLFNPDTNTYKELRECGGCNYAYECVGAWQSKEGATAFYPETKDAAYCEKQTADGAC